MKITATLCNFWFAHTLIPKIWIQTNIHPNTHHEFSVPLLKMSFARSSTLLSFTRRTSRVGQLSLPISNIVVYYPSAACYIVNKIWRILLETAVTCSGEGLCYKAPSVRFNIALNGNIYKNYIQYCGVLSESSLLYCGRYYIFYLRRLLHVAAKDSIIRHLG